MKILREDRVVKKTVEVVIDSTWHIPFMNRYIDRYLLPVSVELAIAFYKHGIVLLEMVSEGEREVRLDYKGNKEKQKSRLEVNQSRTPKWKRGLRVVFLQKYQQLRPYFADWSIWVVRLHYIRELNGNALKLSEEGELVSFLEQSWFILRISDIIESVESVHKSRREAKEW